MLLKILVVDDDKTYHELWHAMLDRYVTLISAYSIEEAEALFIANPDVALIGMDSCVPGNKPTTIPLVKKIRETFAGPMVAISGDATYRAMLVSAGCDFECEKHLLDKKVLAILEL